MAEISIPSDETVSLDSSYVYGFTTTTQDSTNGEILTLAKSTAFSQINTDLTIVSLSLITSSSHTQTKYGATTDGGGGGGDGGSTDGENWRN